MTTKVLYLDSAFTIKDAVTTAEDSSVFIEGYASTTDIDRSGDVVAAGAWEQGLTNYLKNPIILANHDYDDPCGRMVEHKVDAKGLWIKARISAASEIYGLVKDKVVSAFSIGFKIVDAEYNPNAEIFLIKKLELMEISVVSVPCNQNTLFTLSKSLKDQGELKKFKEQFAVRQAKAASTQIKEINMTPEEIKQMLADAAKAATDELIQKQKAEAELVAKKLADEAAIEAKVKAAVAAHIEVGQSGTEKLLKEVEQRLELQSKNALAGLEAALAEKSAEIAKMNASKMQFAGDKAKDSSYNDRETAYMLGKLTGKGIEGTQFGRTLVEKVGQHLPSATWELEVSLNMEAEIRRRLVMAPLLRSIDMKTNVMTIPVNPEAGLASWVQNSAFGTTTSAGGTTATTGQTPGVGSPHALKEITLNAYKVATIEYLNFEEQEDSLIVLMPIIRDAMIRRVSRAMDRAFLLGQGIAADPVKGVSLFDTTSVVTPSVTGLATINHMRQLRKDLGGWGLDPAEVTYVVSTEVYYDLLDDPVFQTMNQVGVQATLLTGQVGQIGNSPVLVSAEFPTKASGTATGTANIGAIAFASGNFIAGNQRGLRFDTQDMVEYQRKAMVASLRTGLTQVTTNLGPGVSTLRWAV